MEAPVGIEPTMAELQSTALPLCYGALVKALHFKLPTAPESVLIERPLF